LEGVTHACVRTHTLMCTVNTYARAHMHARTNKHVPARVRRRIHVSYEEEDTSY